MTSYKYRALDGAGTPVEGDVEAESARAVVEQLQTGGLTVTSVTSEEEAIAPVSRKTRLSWQDLILFNEQLAAITRAGLPIAPSLAAISKEIDNPRIKAVFEDIRENLESGRTLSEALDRHAGALSPAYCAMIRTGETTGSLTAILESMTTYSRRMVDLQYAIQQTLVYPMILIGVALGIFLFLCVRVIPVFAEIFGDFGARLPGQTQFLVNVTAPIARNPMGTISGCLVGYLVLLTLVYRLVSGRGMSLLGDWLSARILVFGAFFTNISLARFCRTLGHLVEYQIPMGDALVLASTAAGNSLLSKRIHRAAAGVETGKPLSEALRETGGFRNSFCWFLENAEQRGDVGRTLLRLADDYERTVETLRRWVSMMGGPVVIVGIALVFGFIVLSLYLPIFSLGDAVQMGDVINGK